MKEEISPCLNGRARQDGSQQTVIAVSDVTRINKDQNGRRVKDAGDPMFTIDNTTHHGVMVYSPIYKPIKMVRTEKGKALRRAYERGDIQHGYNEFREMVAGDETVSNTITNVQKDYMVTDSVRIRRLTPLECFRLQFGMRNAAIMIAKACELKISDTQLYKMAGNAVSSPVVEMIGRKLLQAVEG